MYGGTRRYYKSEHIRVIIHTGSNQTYANTYQIRTLVHSRYRSQQIHIPGLYRFRTYPKTNRIVGSYQSHLRLIQFLMLITGLCLFFRYESTHGYHRDYSDTGVPVGTIEHIQRYIQIFILFLFSVLSYVLS